MGCELAVLSGGGQLAQHILIQVALHIQIGNVMLIQVIQSGMIFCRPAAVGIRNMASLSCTGQSRPILLVYA